MVIEAKTVPLPIDFEACPLWRYDDEDDLYHPILSDEQLPESERMISIRAKFRTPGGVSLDGYIVGIERVFSIGLFGDGRTFHANKNLPDLSKKQMSAFLLTQPQLEGMTVEDLFPLEYVTTIHKAPFIDFGGHFDILKEGGR